VRPKGGKKEDGRGCTDTSLVSGFFLSRLGSRGK
jgi:hypothetical protein